MSVAVEIIQVTRADLEAMLDSAMERAVAKARTELADEQLSTQEAMDLTGYNTPEYFRNFCKENDIQPVAVRRRKNFYLKAELLKANRQKYGRA